MASLTLDDLAGKFQSETFKATLRGTFTKALSFFGSGFLTEAPDEVVDPNQTGTFGNLPQWNTDTSDPDQITTSSTTTINKLSAYKDRFAWMELEKGWGAQELVNTVAGRGSDMIEEIAVHIGEYWAYALQKRAINVLKGNFATALASSHSTGNTYSGAAITNAGVLAAKYKLGDWHRMLNLILMHSKVHGDAVTNNLITFPAGPVGSNTFITGNPGQILGLMPFADDDLTATAGVYSTFLGGRGSMVYKLRNRPGSAMSNRNVIKTGGIHLELTRDAKQAGGTDEIITRISCMVHTPGVAWEDAAPENPTLAQLATGSNWQKVAPDKLIRIAELKTQ
ncbi:MAG: hypothetical protein J0M37_08605 [Ignavibacteria bacterium]|nr:hypothetical protein [Ignavibacteria bacterium]